MKRQLWRGACALILVAQLVISLALGADLVFSRTGSEQNEKSGVTLDQSNAHQGYILLKCKSSKVIVVRVTANDVTAEYFLNANGEFQTLPLQLGSGKYKVQVYEQIQSTKGGGQYSGKASFSLSVKLDDENAAFLAPSVHVWYTEDSAVIAKSNEICAGATTDKEKVDAVYKYLVENIIYDFIKAATIRTQKGYVPVLDTTMETKRGICYDYSALMAAMLRVQGVPTQLCMGRVGKDKTYHAWNKVLIDGTWVIKDATLEAAKMNQGIKDTDYLQENFF